MRHCLLPGVGLLLLAVTPGQPARSDTYSARQYYSGWVKPTSKPYSYRYYYYKPTADYVGYKYQYVIHYPSRPKYYYYYNPYKKVYWGRCPSHCDGKPAYSQLPPEACKSRLEDIAESDFPPMGNLPKIPESNDGATVDLPPSDAPPAETLP
jgi:hypothetical protein